MSTISEQEYITRIRQLEGLNATLAAEVDRLRREYDKVRSIMAVAEVLADHGVSVARYNDLQTVVDQYRDAMTQLAKGGQYGTQPI
jgi:hypothetical protein